MLVLFEVLLPSAGAIRSPSEVTTPADGHGQDWTSRIILHTHIPKTSIHVCLGPPCEHSVQVPLCHNRATMPLKRVHNTAFSATQAGATTLSKHRDALSDSVRCILWVHHLPRLRVDAAAGSERVAAEAMG